MIYSKYCKVNVYKEFVFYLEVLKLAFLVSWETCYMEQRDGIPAAHFIFQF